MDPKRFILVGTLAFAVSVGSNIWSSNTSSAAPLKSISTSKIKSSSSASNPAADAQFQKLLGVSSDDEIYDALYQGYSLADIAAANDADIQEIIHLQIAEMTNQLDARLKQGNLTPSAYRAQKQELPEIITKSVHGLL
ncbi:hypothetical protein [Paenibacillus nasutitermitis]|uniref:Uncharacterized protein n=1 Tax=Paenibacillus nasutitermitis TaxID=1652958 RepID=A0A917E325_9BACL|nr:hypothetical protein [Paenibacillus nasutitermitis]GGD98088.1 hypothetical protein GCM10010911_66120 [Paenibacillus nasutitermitis]